MGRQDRRQQARDSDDDDTPAPAECCWLCLRPLGDQIDRYHLIPKSRAKSRDDKTTVPVHPICRRTVEAVFTNAELARNAGNREKLIEHPEIERFLGWVTDKAADFDAPVAPRRKR